MYMLTPKDRHVWGEENFSSTLPGSSGLSNNQIGMRQMNRRKLKLDSMYTSCTNGRHPGILRNSAKGWKPSPQIKTKDVGVGESVIGARPGKAQ